MMSTKVSCATSPAPRHVWNELLDADHAATVFQSPMWLDCICAMGNHRDASRLYQTEDGRRLLIPMVRRTRLPTPLATQASLPAGWGFGGLLADGLPQAGDISAILDDLAHQSVLSTSLKPGPLATAAWQEAARTELVQIPHVVHILDLSAGFDHVWSKRFTTKTRGHIRKAERSRLVIDSDASGKYVPIFYELYRRWLERRATEGKLPPRLARWLGERQDPLRKIARIADGLGEACRIWVAWLDGQPAASSIVLAQGATASYWRSASDKPLAAPTAANDLIQKMAIEYACRSGCRYYSMGESGGVASLMDFKERFGAEPRRYFEYRIERLPLTSANNYLRKMGDQARGVLSRAS